MGWGCGVVAAVVGGENSPLEASGPPWTRTLTGGRFIHRTGTCIASRTKVCCEAFLAVPRLVTTIGIRVRLFAALWFSDQQEILNILAFAPTLWDLLFSRLIRLQRALQICQPSFPVVWRKKRSKLPPKNFSMRFSE